MQHISLSELELMNVARSTLNVSIPSLQVSEQAVSFANPAFAREATGRDAILP